MGYIWANGSRRWERAAGRAVRAAASSRVAYREQLHEARDEAGTDDLLDRRREPDAEQAPDRGHLPGVCAGADKVKAADKVRLLTR